MGKEAMHYLTLQKNVSMRAAAPTHGYLAVINAIALSHYDKMVRLGMRDFVQATSSTSWLSLDLSNYFIKI